MLRPAVTLGALLLLASCTSPKPPIHFPKAATIKFFEGLEAAPSGMAKIYIFRPDLNGMLVREQPVLKINGEEVSDLRHRSYLALELMPGQYTLTLAPRRFEAESWHSSATFQVAPNEIYFMSVLKESDYAVREAADKARSLNKTATQLTQDRPKPSGVTFLFMEQLQALPLLSGLQYLEPKHHRLTAAP